MADLDEFPSTRYRGSKRKVIPWIYEHLRTLHFESALDLFGGTTSVSYLLKRMGKKVICNDKLHFNYLIALALIENDDVNLSREDIERLVLPFRAEDERPNFVTTAFKDIFFTDIENQQIDNISARISSIDDGTNRGRVKAALALYALFQTCLVKRPFNLFHRKNLYLRLAQVERSFGNKSTWDKPLYSHFEHFASEVNRFVFRGNHPCHALNQDALKVPVRGYDLVYIDPPYVPKERGETVDYQRCYHFLEGLSRYSDWNILIDYSTRNHRFKNDADNPWIKRGANLKAFDQLFDKFRNSILVISYKKYGAPSLTTLVRMLNRHGRKTSVHTRHYSYALNHQNGDAELNREALIISV